MTAPRDDTDFPLPDPARDDPADGPDDVASDPFADDGPAENPFDLGDDLLPPPPPADPFGAGGEDGEEDGGGTYALGEATVPPKWGVGSVPPPQDLLPADLPPDDLPPGGASRNPAPVAAGVGGEEDAVDEPAPKPARRPKGPPKPKIRDWIEERSRKEAKMYALGAAVLGPVGLLALLLTWGVLYLVVRNVVGGVVGWALAAALLGGLFWLNRKAGDARSVRVVFDPEEPGAEPVVLDVPRGSGLTWLMYLTGSRDLPGWLQFLGTVTLFGPRLCELVYRMARAAQHLWTIDAAAVAEPLKTLVRAEGKVSFAAFFGHHSKRSPQGLVDRLGRIDGVLFLPTSQPPGLCVSNAMKDEFAAWRTRWQERRIEDDRLYD